MRWIHIVKTAIASLRINKSRSLLTVLGIIIGIASIILIISLGQGAERLILGQVQGIGSRTIGIIPGRQPTGISDVAQMFSDSLKEKDLEALKRKENVPNAEIVMPIVFGADTASYGNETFRVTIFGATDEIQQLLDVHVERGSFFTEDDVRSLSDGIVIGVKTKEKLFGADDALGKKIRIKEKNLRVIGILPSKGQSSFFDFDESVIMPYTTAQQYVLGIKYFNRISVQASSEDVLTSTLLDIENTLRDSHGIDDPQKDDFFVETSADVVSRLGVITTALTALLSALAAISLVVGGIGIMNIMLVSVTERTKEIGLRKAIGATETDILSQFLIEAVFLTLLGGLVGVASGVGLSLLASFAINTFAGIAWTFIFPLKGAILGVVASALVGLVFGIYPAREAARKSPIESMRFE